MTTCLHNYMLIYVRNFNYTIWIWVQYPLWALAYALTNCLGNRYVCWKHVLVVNNFIIINDFIIFRLLSADHLHIKNQFSIFRFTKELCNTHISTFHVEWKAKQHYQQQNNIYEADWRSFIIHYFCWGKSYLIYSPYLLYNNDLHP